MHIAIDASRTTIARRTGTENYALQLIRALLQQGADHQFTLYFRDQPSVDLFPPYANVQTKVIPFARLWTHLRFAAELWRDRPDVTFVPAHTLPLFFPGKAVVTIHDLGYRFFPEAHPKAERNYLDSTTRFSARRGTLILADSEATKRDLMTEYGVAANRIRVVYPGVEGLRRANDDQIAAVRAKYSLPERYFLFLGTLQPRKNIRRLIEAFVLSQGMNLPNDIALVLAGKRGWLIDQALDSTLNTLTDQQRARIIMPGYIADEDVSALYSGALALTFPSLYEGFGFPVLEAIHCGTSVLCSNTSSLPELAGDTALLVDPLSTESIANGMVNLANNPGLRAELAERGYPQASKFTWQQTAAMTLEAFESLQKLKI